MGYFWPSKLNVVIIHTRKFEFEVQILNACKVEFLDFHGTQVLIAIPLRSLGHYVIENRISELKYI